MQFDESLVLTLQKCKFVIWVARYVKMHKYSELKNHAK